MTRGDIDPLSGAPPWVLVPTVALAILALGVAALLRLAAWPFRALFARGRP